MSVDLKTVTINEAEGILSSRDQRIITRRTTKSGEYKIVFLSSIILSEDGTGLAAHMGQGRTSQLT